MEIASRRPRIAARRWWQTLCVCLAGLAGAPQVRAADVTDEQARQLEQQLRAWMTGVVGQNVNVGDRPVEVTAGDDHFHLAIPLNNVPTGFGGSMSGAPVSAELRPLADDRWNLDFKLPSPLTVVSPNPKAPGSITSVATMAEQENHAVIDPSLATASSIDNTMRGYAIDTTGPGGEQHVRAEHSASHTTVMPSSAGRVNLLTEGDMQLLTANMIAPDVGTVSMSAERGHGMVRADNVALDRVGPIIRAMVELAPQAALAIRLAAAVTAAPAAAPNAVASDATPTLSAQDRATLRTALLALRDLAAGFDEQVTIEDVHVQAAKFSGRIGKFAAGMGLSAPDGKLMLRLRLALDGLDSPAITAGPFRDFVPRHIALAPRLGGVPGGSAMDLLIRGTDSDWRDPSLQSDAEALLAQGPITLGLDELAFDVGPAAVTGSGELQIVGREHYTGHAHLAATGLDGLIRRANPMKMLKQAAPALIFLKGIGEQDGDTTVWDVTYEDGRILVNGTDMTQMMPGR